jgi:hypothetical protein
MDLVTNFGSLKSSWVLAGLQWKPSYQEVILVEPWKEEERRGAATSEQFHVCDELVAQFLPLPEA